MSGGPAASSSLSFPLCFIGTVFVFTLDSGDKDPVFQIFIRRFVLGAIFHSYHDYLPLEHQEGRIVFGIGCGVITVDPRFRRAAGGRFLLDYPDEYFSALY